jgi:acetyl-CoA C-acetyltransferase
LDLAGIGSDDLAHVDLYSCFPSAVQISAAALGLSLERPLTVTGGMSFAGGPWNNYATHSIATMVGVLREDPGAWGLCSGNGGFVTKHAIGIYRTEAPAQGFRWAKPQDEVDAVAGRPAADGHVGRVTVEGLVVMHDRDGAPENALAALLTPDGGRAWGTTNDPATMKAMTEEEFVNRPADLSPEGRLEF